MVLHEHFYFPGVTEYNQALEEELQNLKAKCRSLEEQSEQALRTTNPIFTSAPVHSVAPDNAYVQNHIRSLNETIGILMIYKETAHNMLLMCDILVSMT